MKKSVLILSIFATVNLFGQSLSNGGFESWNSTPYDEPANWYSSNPQSIIQLGIINVTKVTGFSGQAVHMQTYISAGDTDFGFVTNTAGDPKNASGGIPYTQQSTGIGGYCRYYLPVKDTAIMMVIFKKNGSVIGNYSFKFRGATGNQPTFTSFNFTFTPALATAPDSVIIATASSNVFTNIGVQNGSWLEIDELTFSGPNSTIPNGTFDTWNSLSQNIPLGWSMSTGGPTGSGVSRSNIAFAGNYSISLTTQSSGGGGGNNNAFISNGYQSANNGPKGGRPYTNNTMDSLRGYYQYSTPGNDSAVVNVLLTKNGSGVGGTFAELPKKAAWTYFHIPFQAFSAPDTILVSFGSGTWGPNSTVGSTLLLDNVSLYSQPLGVVNPIVSTEQNVAYPNPVKDILNIQFSNIIPGTVHIYVYDITGRVVKENVFTTSENVLHVNISELQPGIYFYRFETQNGSILNRFIKE